jgi:mono/diheme cytochrome c family protein
MALALLIFLGVLGLFQAGPFGAAQVSAQTSSERGKKIFVARCAKCHDDDMSKKLPDGSTLLGRLAASKDPKSRLATRLKDAADRDAVLDYFLQLPARRSQESGAAAQTNPPKATPDR